MARMDEVLETMCRTNPHQYQDVIITLAETAEHMQSADLGLDDAKEIGIGIFSGTFRGHTLLELSKRPEVEEITFDARVSALHAGA